MTRLFIAVNFLGATVNTALGTTQLFLLHGDGAPLSFSLAALCWSLVAVLKVTK